ncbi:hypothetical protein MCOR25_006875 [Pyricularia grisea]|nr:hypothetical protein MCOR25_006875 [Pyricularia grisea]
MDNTSPNPSNHDTFGLEQLVQHNEMYPHEPTMHSQAPSRYASPAPQYSQPFPDVLPSMGGQDGYGQQFEYASPHSNMGSYPAPDELRRNDRPYSTPATSPPTPEPRMVRAAALRSRSTPRTSPDANLSSTKEGRVTKPKPKKKRPRSEAVPKPKQSIDKPLSQLAEEMDEQIIDIEAFVNRGPEARHAEVMTGKKAGKIKRPMNAFMLYRKAYQLVCKKYCMESNHQVVSRVCADSWDSEPESVRDQFAAWAKIDRDQLHRAHPDYKFTPSKPRSSYMKKVRSEMDLSDDEFDGEYVPRGTRTRGRDTPDSSYYPNPSGRYTPLHDPDQWNTSPAIGNMMLPTSHPYQPLPAYNLYPATTGQIIHPMPSAYGGNDAFGLLVQGGGAHHYQHGHGGYRAGSTPPEFVDDFVPRSSATPANSFEQGLTRYSVMQQQQPHHYHQYTNQHQQQQGHADWLHQGRQVIPSAPVVSSQPSIDPSLATPVESRHVTDANLPSTMPGLDLGPQDPSTFDAFYLDDDPLLKEGVDNGTLEESWNISEVEPQDWNIGEVDAVTKVE